MSKLAISDLSSLLGNIFVTCLISKPFPTSTSKKCSKKKASYDFRAVNDYRSEIGTGQRSLVSRDENVFTRLIFNFSRHVQNGQCLVSCLTVLVGKWACA